MVQIPDYDQQIKQIAPPMPETGIKPMSQVSGGSVYVGKNYINPKAYTYMYDGINNMMGSFGEMWMGLEKLKHEQIKWKYKMFEEDRGLYNSFIEMQKNGDLRASINHGEF